MIENVHANDTEEDIRAYLRGLIGNRRDLWSYSDRSYQEILDQAERFKKIQDRDNEKDTIKPTVQQTTTEPVINHEEEKKNE